MSDLNLDVYIAPMRRMKGAPRQGPGDEPTSSPMSATLIHGEEQAILIDTLLTFGQVDALADWIDGFGKRLIGMYITHGHSDHWTGLTRLRERLGPVPAWARPKVRAVFEATDPGLSGYWHTVFPGEIPQKRQPPDRLDTTPIELEGSEIRVIDIGQGDTVDSTIVHVPSTVVSGHHRVSAPNDPKSIGESQQYLRDFSRVVETEDTVENIVVAMLEQHPDRDNTRVVWHCARSGQEARPGVNSR